MRERCDVLVVGGGPAGAAAARVAVDAGASVIVVERDPTAAKKTWISGAWCRVMADMCRSKMG